MRRFASVGVLSTGVLCFAVPGAAQVAGSGITPSVVAGVAVPSGDLSAYTNYGYTVGGAVDVRAGQLPVRIRAEGGYTHFSFYRAGANLLDGNRNQWNGGLDLVLPIRARVVTPFLLGGTGIYQVSIRPVCNVMIFDANGAAPTCPGGTSNHSGWSVGGGLEFPGGVLGSRIEARYTRIPIPGGAYSYVPVMFAVRF